MTLLTRTRLWWVGETVWQSRPPTTARVTALAPGGAPSREHRVHAGGVAAVAAAGVTDAAEATAVAGVATDGVTTTEATVRAADRATAVAAAGVATTQEATTVAAGATDGVTTTDPDPVWSSRSPGR